MFPIQQCLGIELGIKSLFHDFEEPDWDARTVHISVDENMWS